MSDQRRGGIECPECGYSVGRTTRKCPRCGFEPTIDMETAVRKLRESETDTDRTGGERDAE